MISRNKAMFLILLFLVVGVAFSGCTSSEITSGGGGQQQAPEVASDKKGDTVLTGTITQAGEKFFLQQPGKELQDIESYSIDLASYTGKNVTVTGQFSGDTLFIGKIE